MPQEYVDAGDRVATRLRHYGRGKEAGSRSTRRCTTRSRPSAREGWCEWSTSPNGPRPSKPPGWLPGRNGVVAAHMTWWPLARVAAAPGVRRVAPTSAGLPAVALTVWSRHEAFRARPVRNRRGGGGVELCGRGAPARDGGHETSAMLNGKVLSTTGGPGSWYIEYGPTAARTEKTPTGRSTSMPTNRSRCPSRSMGSIRGRPTTMRSAPRTARTQATRSAAPTRPSRPTPTAGTRLPARRRSRSVRAGLWLHHRCPQRTVGRGSDRGGRLAYGRRTGRRLERRGHLPLGHRQQCRDRLLRCPLRPWIQAVGGRPRPGSRQRRPGLGAGHVRLGGRGRPAGPRPAAARADGLQLVPRAFPGPVSEGSIPTGDIVVTDAEPPATTKQRAPQ